LSEGGAWQVHVEVPRSAVPLVEAIFAALGHEDNPPVVMSFEIKDDQIWGVDVVIGEPVSAAMLSRQIDRVLAEHGADVLKITAAHLPDSGQVDLDTGLGKLSAQIDLRTPEGTSTLRALAREAEVFSQSYRPGALAGRGFSPETLAELRPGIVCTTLSAWGTTGPWSARRGFDTIVQCVSGIADACAANGMPRYLPVSVIDYVSGYLMALGTMVALARRAQEGGSWLVRVSLARTGQWIVDRGSVAPSALQGLPEEFPADELARLVTEVDAPDGRVRHLKPVVQMPDTPTHWARPPVPLGYHKPEWPPR